jgi:hypothetical protein
LQVPLFGVPLPRHAVWFGGLVLYGGANGFYAMSLVYAPLSLLAGVFTTLLVFNLGELSEEKGGCPGWGVKIAKNRVAPRCGHVFVSAETP